MSKDVNRLYNNFQPQTYVLELKPDRLSKKFSGKVIITGSKTGRPSQRLTFHQSGLKIVSAKITKHDKSSQHEYKVDRINNHNSLDEVRLHSNTMIYPGSYTVEMLFKGKITKNMNGIYPCDFVHEGRDKQLIATQFESHHAREVFPCIDEPEAKATFDLSITTPKGEEALSNTPIKMQQTNGSETWTTFETTPKMSTYLLAFVYGELRYLEAKTKSGVVVRTYATPDNVQHTQFALDTAVKILDFYNEYFKIPYPLEKCDMVALPDFASGAMENWGLITYREQALFVDSKHTSLAAKQYVAMVVAHELAHQWFGNLVTMRWWTDLWLNEGFASWIEYLAVDHLFPEWDMWTQFAVDEQHRALKLDALKNTHPVEVVVHHPDEIRTIFDTISYSKGASVIHMLNNYLSPDIFRDGLRHYLHKNAYGNTDTVDLWNSLEEISGKPVMNFMHSWTSRPGFPLLQVSIKDNMVTISQQRFYINPSMRESENTLWPVTVLSQLSDLPEIISQKTATYKVADISSLKLNRGQSGFYRTIYDDLHLSRLSSLIRTATLSPLDRLGILSDLLEAAKAGHISATSVLDFVSNFENEDNNAVWDVIAGVIVSIRSVMDDEQLRDAMKPFIRKLIAKQLNRLGWQPVENESHFDSLLRPTILGLASSADETEVVAECLRKFDAMANPEDLAPDIRSVVYQTAVRHGDKRTFDKLFAMHEESISSEERTTIASALTGFRQPELIKKALSKITSASVRNQDVAYWLAYSFSNRHAKRETWVWMTKHWDWLGENLGSDLSFYRFPMYAASAFSDSDFIQEYKSFLRLS